jgi:hypothetical protein
MKNSVLTFQIKSLKLSTEFLKWTIFLEHPKKSKKKGPIA